MKNITQYLILISLILLINPVFGFPGMTANTTGQLDLNNTTDSDKDINLIQHLIEVDAIQMQAQNKLMIRETVIFKNQGTRNFFGTLRTWVPDGSENISMTRNNMMDGSFQYAISPIQNGNIISWQDAIDNKSLPPLYYLEYMVPAGVTKKQYLKKLSYPAAKEPKSFILIVTRNQGQGVTITDENGINLSGSGNPSEEGNRIQYGWETPQFKEFTIEFSGSVVSPAEAQRTIDGPVVIKNYTVYILIGIIIILVLLSPFIIKKIKSGGEKTEKQKTDKPEEKINKKPKSKQQKDEPEISKEGKVKMEFPEFKGKTKQELLNLKTELLSKLNEIEKEYKSGNMLDEEYDDLKRSYSEKVNEITRKVEKA